MKKLKSTPLIHRAFLKRTPTVEAQRLLGGRGAILGGKPKVIPSAPKVSTGSKVSSVVHS